MKLSILTRVSAAKNDQKNKTFNHEQYIGTWLQRQRMWNVRLRKPSVLHPNPASCVRSVSAASFHPRTALELCS